MLTMTFPYQEVELGVWMPYIPVRLEANGNVVDVMALVDTGSTISVLPNRIGRELGLDWESGKTVLLTGALESEARLMVLDMEISGLGKTKQGFAWARNDKSRIILGNMNFFVEYDVYFSRVKKVLILTSTAKEATVKP
jgi:Aspartyl protease